MTKRRLHTLATSFWVAGAAVFLFASFSATFLVFQIARTEDNTKWANQVYKVSSQLKFLIRDFYRERIDFMNYLRTDRHRDLALFVEDQKLFARTFEILVEAERDIPGAMEQITPIKTYHDEWLKLTNDLTIRRSDQAEKMKREEELHRTIRSVIDQAISYHDDLLSSRASYERGVMRRTYILISVVVFIFLLMIAIVLRRLYTSIARPIQSLTQAVEAYRSGDLNSRVTVTSRNQIGFLQSAFNEMAESVTRMVEDLKRLDQLKTDFLSTVSHELRTPLTSIGGYIKLILAGDAGPVDPTQKEFLSIADKNVDRLTLLINDLLDVEKIEAGRVQLVRESLDLRDLLREAVRVFQPLADEKKLNLELLLPDRPLAVHADRARLLQVFFNLISNAIKYTKNGYVRISARQEHETAILVFEDTGQGIDGDEQKNLFQKFYRTRHALKSDVGGTGLGLVIAKNLLEAHSGDIQLESELGKGSKFTVMIPAESLEERVSTLSDRAENVDDVGHLVHPWSALKTFWIVDRDIVERDQLVELIRSEVEVKVQHSFEIRTFNRLEDLRIPDQESGEPNVVILDAVTIEDRFGPAFELVRNLLGRSVPIIVLGESDDTGRVFDFGASALIRKPVKRNRLVSAILNVIGTKPVRVLIAEDDRDFRFLVKRSLEQRGFQVDDVDRGEQVIRRLKSESYDLALLQSEFPDLAGVEIVKFMESEKILPQTRVIVMVEDDLPRKKVEFKALGVVDFVAKTKGVETVVDSICEALEPALEKAG